ncbi:hypothetical protein BLNAU_16244 [Blattamonas nauphoetae]|uniref:Uncharacterized protein n=1 Tax=Blattamonas nauphoetae TaxID=2049346 RepID=A0ABQ9XBN6_9EUKA|nr:hypothetical protein BLNAU_16244 [Blattamonas nauphoetae]
MEEASGHLRASTGQTSSQLSTIKSSVSESGDLFLNDNPYSKMSLTDKFKRYNSLVSLVEVKYPFDEIQQGKAVLILESFKHLYLPSTDSNKNLAELVPSRNGTSSGFLDSVLTLVSSPHTAIASAAVPFSMKVFSTLTPSHQLDLLKNDYFSKTLTIFRPQTFPIASYPDFYVILVETLHWSLGFVKPYQDKKSSLTDPQDQPKGSEFVMRKVIVPSSQYLHFLCQHINALSEWLEITFTFFLNKLLLRGPIHPPLLEFVLASPVVMTVSSRLASVQSSYHFLSTLRDIYNLLTEWKKHGPEVAQSAKRMLQALFSEGFEDTLEQIFMHKKKGRIGRDAVRDCNLISQLLGLNVQYTEADVEEDTVYEEEYGVHEEESGEREEETSQAENEDDTEDEEEETSEYDDETDSD